MQICTVALFTLRCELIAIPLFPHDLELTIRAKGLRARYYCGFDVALKNARSDGALA